MDRNDLHTSRRQIVGGIATGLAAAASTTPAFAQDAASPGGVLEPGLRNPVTKHPAPPFARQVQEGPASRPR